MKLATCTEKLCVEIEANALKNQSGYLPLDTLMFDLHVHILNLEPDFGA